MTEQFEVVGEEDGRQAEAKWLICRERRQTVKERPGNRASQKRAS